MSNRAMIRRRYGVHRVNARAIALWERGMARWMSSNKVIGRRPALIHNGRKSR